MLVYILTGIAGILAAPFLRLRFFVYTALAVVFVMVVLPFSTGGWSVMRAVAAFAVMQITYLASGLALEVFRERRQAARSGGDRRRRASNGRRPGV